MIGPRWEEDYLIKKNMSIKTAMTSLGASQLGKAYAMRSTTSSTSFRCVLNLLSSFVSSLTIIFRSRPGTTTLIAIQQILQILQIWENLWKMFMHSNTNSNSFIASPVILLADLIMCLMTCVWREHQSSDMETDIWHSLL